MSAKVRQAKGAGAESWRRKCNPIRYDGHGDTNFYKIGESECILPKYFLPLAEKIQNFSVREDDTWVCSFPKCGTTWVQEMVWLLANNLDYDGAKVPLWTRFPFLEESTLFNDTSDNNSIARAESTPSPRFIKSHLTFDLLPQEIMVKKPKLIYVTRNVKDAFVSYFHHSVLDGYMGSMDEFGEEFLSSDVLYAPFWGNFKSYWEHRKESNILILSFEEMKMDLLPVLRKTAEFLGAKYSDDELNVLRQHLSFESMKDNQAVNYEVLLEQGAKAIGVERKTKFMRKGQVGAGRDEMSPELQRKFDEWNMKFGCKKLVASWNGM